MCITYITSRSMNWTGHSPVHVRVGVAVRAPETQVYAVVPELLLLYPAAHATLQVTVPVLDRVVPTKEVQAGETPAATTLLPRLPEAGTAQVIAANHLGRKGAFM